MDLKLFSNIKSLLTLVTGVKAKTDNIPASPATQATAAAAALDALEIETHFHNREYWFGLAAAPTGTHFADRARLTPFVATSGNGDFGTDVGDEASVIGSADLPVRGGSTIFDLRRFSIVDVSTATPFILRIIHGTGTMADAETAGQYTEIAVHEPTAAGQNKPVDNFCERIAVGEFVWVRAKNATNNATVQFLIGLHEYPAPAQP